MPPRQRLECRSWENTFYRLFIGRRITGAVEPQYTVFPSIETEGLGAVLPDRCERIQKKDVRQGFENTDAPTVQPSKFVTRFVNLREHEIEVSSEDPSQKRFGSATLVNLAIVSEKGRRRSFDAQIENSVDEHQLFERRRQTAVSKNERYGPVAAANSSYRQTVAAVLPIDDPKQRRRILQGSGVGKPACRTTVS